MSGNMATQFINGGIEPQQVTRTGTPKQYLFGPKRDFLTFGGSSLLILPLLLLIPLDQYKAGFAIATMLLAHVINHPHFAHSYQLFYRDFGRKAFTSEIGREMQLRFLFAGVLAPLLLVGLLAYGVITGNLRLLGYAGNAMALFVGWHYVKQGYGLLMVDCALKKRFFDDPAKKILLINSYAVWIAAWCYFNRAASQSSLWGIEYIAFALPVWSVALAVGLAIGTTATAFYAIWRTHAAKGVLPWNGLIAYGVSLYLWLAFVKINPLWLLLTPALHSLQYLAVVWRFETNFAVARYSASDNDPTSSGKPKIAKHLLVFVLIGTGVGFIGFWGAPLVMTTIAQSPTEALGIGIYLFCAWIFINVHHYFMDNVMWRRDNPDTKKYLFG